MVAFLKSIADARWFSNFIIGIILLAGVLVGIQTYPSMVEAYGPVMDLGDKIILWIFVVEIVIKMGSEGKEPWRYFFDTWNLFDFLIVAVCFMPVHAEYVAVLRLARLLRVMKLVKALPELQILVSALLKSIPSMFYISVLLFLLFYLYGVMATFLYQGNDPVHFESLQLSMLSLYRVATFEDWTDIMYINMYGCAAYGYDGLEALCTQNKASGWSAAIFFTSFTVIATMVILNLFIGVIMNGMDEAKAEMEAELKEALMDATETDENRVAKLANRLADLTMELTDLQKDLSRILDPKGR